MASLFTPADPVFAAELARSRQEGRAEEREFNSAAAEEARVVSRGEFADASDAEAVRIAREAFADVLTGPTEAGEEALSRGLEIEGFTGQYTAQVVTATGEPYGIMDSTAPLTADPSGDEPIDLSLS